MLETIARFRNSLSEVQLATLQSKAGRHWDGFQRLIDSQDEDEAEVNFEALKRALKEVPMMTLLSIHGELSTEQKEILSEIL
jgi:hypothetical protein